MVQTNVLCVLPAHDSLPLGLLKGHSDNLLLNIFHRVQNPLEVIAVCTCSSPLLFVQLCLLCPPPTSESKQLQFAEYI